MRFHPNLANCLYRNEDYEPGIYKQQSQMIMLDDVVHNKGEWNTAIETISLEKIRKVGKIPQICKITQKK